MPKLDPIDETFLDAAPQRFSEAFEIARPAEQVWADLTADDTLRFARIIKRIEWTSPRPFGVGTTRTAHALGGTMKLQERYFRWEEGRRKTFMGVHANLPLFRSVAEDYLVEPTGEGSCRFTWTIGVAPSAAGRPGAPVNKLLFGSLFADTRKHYDVR